MFNPDRINQLTPEQKALIPDYQNKWRKLLTSTETIDKNIAVETVKSIYNFVGLPEPKIIFLKNFDMKSFLDVDLDDILGIIYQIEVVKHHNIDYLNEQLSTNLSISLDSKIVETYFTIWKQQEGLWCEIWFEWINYRNNQILDQEIHRKIRNFNYNNYIKNESMFWLWQTWNIYGYQIDFYISELNLQYDAKIWKSYKSLAKNCGWIFPFQEVCLIAPRPIKFSLDESYRLHAEAEPALEFADGFIVYAYNGVRLPEKYGKIHPKKWNPQWLLTENNAELRRVLIQGIGYSRIIEELQAIQIDSWQEYRLLKIKKDIDIEPIHLLKMTCPSTGHIHVLRVPHNITSAREAIIWINWGVEPEDFAVQT